MIDPEEFNVDRAFTAILGLLFVWAVIVIAVVIGVIFVAAHFIEKAW